MVNIGFADRGVDAEFAAILQAESDGTTHDQIVDGFNRRGSQLVKSVIESFVFLGHWRTVEASEASTAVSVGAPLAQFAIVAVLNPADDIGAEGLLGC